MHSWLAYAFFFGLTGLMAFVIIGWERENRAKAKRRLEQSQNSNARSEEGPQALTIDEIS
jgi:hypothetical protein